MIGEGCAVPNNSSGLNLKPAFGVGTTLLNKSQCPHDFETTIMLNHLRLYRSNFVRSSSPSVLDLGPQKKYVLRCFFGPLGSCCKDASKTPKYF